MERPARADTLAGVTSVGTVVDVEDVEVEDVDVDDVVDDVDDVDVTVVDVVDDVDDVDVTVVDVTVVDVVDDVDVVVEVVEELTVPEPNERPLADTTAPAPVNIPTTTPAVARRNDHDPTRHGLRIQANVGRVTPDDVVRPHAIPTIHLVTSTRR